MLHCRVNLNSSLSLPDRQVYVFDLDGVLYLGDTAIPYAADAVSRLLENGKRVYFLTNNSGKTRADYRQKLADVNGLDIPESTIFTSAYATALYLKHRAAAGRSVFVIGEPGLAAELAASGGLIPITEPDSVDVHDIDYVVVGIDRKFTYDKLRFAHAAIMRGHAQFIATNRDSTFPMETGEIRRRLACRRPCHRDRPRTRHHRQARNPCLRSHSRRRSNNSRRQRHGRRPLRHRHRRRQTLRRVHRAGADRRHPPRPRKCRASRMAS